MRIAIVGASGLIGTAIARALAARGDDVVGVVRSARAAVAGEQIVWDPSTQDAPAGIFKGCDAVINVAGAPIARRWTNDAWREIVASRVDATGRIATAAVCARVSTLVNGSAVGYYGPTEHAVDETSPAGEGALADLCVRWERATEEASSGGVRVTLLRTGVVLAREGGALAKMLTPAKLGMGGPLAGGGQWFPWIHIDDAVGLVLWAIDGVHPGPVNLVAPGIVRQREFADTLGGVLHRPAVLPTPGFALRLLLGESAGVVTEGQQVRARVALDGGYSFTFPELPAALADLVG